MNFAMSWWVLAQGNAGRVRGIRDSFGGSEPGGGLGTTILLLMSATVAILVAYAWLKSRQAPKPVRDALKLFDDALASLGLSSEDQSLLRRMVRDLGLEQPAKLFLSAGYYDRTVDSWVARSPAKQRTRLAARLRSIRTKAFSDRP